MLFSKFARTCCCLLLVGFIGTGNLLNPSAFAQEAAPPAAETPAAEAPAPQEPAAAAETPAADAPAEGAAETEGGEETKGAEAPDLSTPEKAKDAGSTPDVKLTFALNNITLFICAVLVLFMQAGFAILEAGLNPAKHVVNILAKNVLDMAVGTILFFGVGYAIMYPVFDDQSIMGAYFDVDTSRLFAITAWDGAATLHPQVDFLFQVAFAATAATIVSGAVAGRMKFGAYLVYTIFITAWVYPVSGSWKWGYGWLHQAGFHDFAGSIVVHAVGGFAALAGAMLLGPRIGRFSKDGKSTPIPGHNMSLVALGGFILLIGWFGFNPGSQLVFADHTNVGIIMTVAVNTLLAGSAGCVVCMVIAWFMYGKPDLSMIVNGLLAGLVGITANCDCVTNTEAILIGAVAGIVVLIGIILLEKLKIDDPVGAFPVHGLCGMWGGIATGFFGEGKDMMWQVIGTLTISGWAFVNMLILFAILKAVGFLRVSAEEEQEGLDISEHGMHAYPAS